MPGSKGTADNKSVEFEEFVPSSGWTEDSSSHYLLVDLPDFRQENVKLDVNDSGYITISGERKISDLKYRRFQLTIKVPEDADANMIIGKLEGGMLQIIVPKQDKEEEEEATEEEYKDLEDENGASSEAEKVDEDEKSTCEYGEHHGSHIEERIDEDEGALKYASNEEGRLKGREKSTMLLYLVKKIERNKGSILAVVFAFTLGVLITHKIDDLRLKNIVYP